VHVRMGGIKDFDRGWVGNGISRRRVGEKVVSERLNDVSAYHVSHGHDVVVVVLFWFRACIGVGIPASGL
jgi:hypothetical protein